MQFGESFKHNLVKPFEGRASRSEFWWFFLWFFIITVVPYILIMSTVVGMVGFGDLENGTAPAFLGGAAILFIPVMFVWIFLVYWIGLAIFCTGMRRLHDTNRSAWWYFIAFVPFGFIVLIVFYCQRGTDGPNRFGEDPLQPVDSDVFR